MSTEPDDHRGLRERLRGGEEAAFAQLFEEHADAVFGLARRLTGDGTTAEDVTSESFLLAWKKRDEIEVDDRPLRPWLLAMAARLSWNATRGTRRRHAFLAQRSSARPDVVEDFADETVGRLDDARLLARARDALRHLSRHEAEVLALCVWSELTYAEAAAALQVPVGTVRSRLARARARLRDLTEHSSAVGAARTSPVPSLTKPSGGAR